MFGLNTWWGKFVDRHPVIIVTGFALIVVLSVWFLFGMNDRIKSLFQSHTLTSVMTDIFELEGDCRENYSTIGIRITGEVQFLAWTSRINGKAVGEPSPSYTVKQRIRPDHRRLSLLDADGNKLRDVSADTVDYNVPDRITMNLYARGGHKPDLRAGKTTLEATGEFETYDVSMVCDLKVRKKL